MAHQRNQFIWLAVYIASLVIGWVLSRSIFVNVVDAFSGVQGMNGVLMGSFFVFAFSFISFVIAREAGKGLVELSTWGMGVISTLFATANLGVRILFGGTTPTRLGFFTGFMIFLVVGMVVAGAIANFVREEFPGEGFF